jgi:hypothetical protein
VTDTNDLHLLASDRAPTPFTAEEIRGGCPTGRTIRLLVELESQPPFVRVNRFVHTDAEGSTVERTRYTLEGELIGSPETDRTTWLQLQAHASFPAAVTEIHPETIETPLGSLDCLRYTVVDGSATDSFWFAPSAPGMPVRYTSEEDGRVTSTVTMIENRLP